MEINELKRVFLERQEKYVYYIIALSAAGIGFALYRTDKTAINWNQIPLGAAVLSWALSVYCGLKFLAYSISEVANTVDYMYLNQGIFRGQKVPDVLLGGAKKSAMDAMQLNSKRATRYFTGLKYLCYFGGVLYIVYQVLVMIELERCN